MTLPHIVLVAAVAENGVIGRGGVMPWRLKSDMAQFRALTTGKPVLMGRKTWLSLHLKPLPGRTNIVVSRDPAFTAPGVLVARSFETAMEAARGDAARRGNAPSGGADIMIIGGADIYAQALPLAERLEITHVHMAPEGDAYFPKIDPAIWNEIARKTHAAGSGDDSGFDTVTYVRR
jgi:dihydrofolate reductase